MLAQKVENRLIEHCDRKLYGRVGFAGRKVFRAGFEIEFNRLARLIDFLVGPALNFNLLKLVLYLQLGVAYAKGRFTKVFAFGAKGLFNSWGHHHNRDVESGQVIRYNRDLDQLGAVLQGLHPTIEHSVAFHSHQGLCARERVLHENPRRIAHAVLLLIGIDVKQVSFLCFPENVTFPRNPTPHCSFVDATL